MDTWAKIRGKGKKRIEPKSSQIKVAMWAYGFARLIKIFVDQDSDIF